jgi:hypothetical protein
MEEKNDSVQANLDNKVEVFAHMRICNLPGVGPIISGYFAEAGYHTIEDIRAKTMHQVATELDMLIGKKIQNLMEMDARKNKPAYWKKIFKRCESVVWKILNPGTTPIIPDVYTCQVCSDWLTNPVLIKSTQKSCCKGCISDGIGLNFLTSVDDVILNSPLNDAVIFYRANHLKYSIFI